MVFTALIIPDLLGRCFQQFRMHKVILYIRKEPCIMRTRTYALICRNTNREKTFHARLAVFNDRNTLCHSHSEEQADISPVVQMMIHIV